MMLAVGVGVYFLRRRERLRLIVWVAALAGGQLINQLLKAWFTRPRPTFVEPLAVELTYSFPSGHATMSLITYGMLAYFLWIGTTNRAAHVLVTSALISLIILIGVSRMYLGVHYFSDVLAGYASGGLWLTFCITSMDYILVRRARRQAAA